MILRIPQMQLYPRELVIPFFQGGLLSLAKMGHLTDPGEGSEGDRKGDPGMGSF